MAFLPQASVAPGRWRLRRHPIIGHRSGWRASFLFIVLLAGLARAATPAPSCDSCATWNQTQQPFRIFGNAYYVGVRGLSSVLITSKEGHVLIDGDLPESAQKIAASIRALGFRPEDVKLIVNSHVHFDHAGGIAELARLSGARVLASKRGATVIRKGKSGPDDPQFGILLPFPAWPRTATFEDAEVLRVGPIAVTPHLTPGHTPGGTSFTFSSCEGARCLNLVYADSLTPVSAPGFKFTRSADALTDFERSFAVLSTVPCDILISAHPDASGFWERYDKREKTGARDAFIDPAACKKYVEVARGRLKERVAEESLH
jgi:metallo-beta-lactamase class B